MTTDLAPITAASSIEQVSERMDALAALAARIRELKREFEDQMLEYIAEHGPVTIGETRYYAGNEKDTKDHDRTGAGYALYEKCGGDLSVDGLHECGGDFEAFCAAQRLAFERFVEQCLCSQPFKPGTAKSMLGDQFLTYFTVEEKTKIEKGKPRKTVLSVPTKLLAQRAGAQ